MYLLLKNLTMYFSLYWFRHINSWGWWRIYASVNQTTIGWDNSLSLVRRQAIIWIITEEVLVGPLKKTSVAFES